VAIQGFYKQTPMFVIFGKAKMQNKHMSSTSYYNFNVPGIYQHFQGKLLVVEIQVFQLSPEKRLQRHRWSQLQVSSDNLLKRPTTRQLVTHTHSTHSCIRCRCHAATSNTTISIHQCIIYTLHRLKRSLYITTYRPFSARLCWSYHVE